MAAKKHKDVEFHVGTQGIHDAKVFQTWPEASAAAVNIAAQGGSAVIDVVVHSTHGAKWWGGAEAVTRYKEDPEASVFDRFELDINYVGTVP